MNCIKVLPVVCGVLIGLCMNVVQAQNPVEMEGTVSAITPDGQNVKLTVMGADVRVPAGTPVTTPVGSLTFAQLLDTVTPLPGRSVGGFLNGTAIVNGSISGGVITATDIQIEPAENVILGEVTTNNASGFSVNGVSIQLIDDARLKAKPPRNEFGFDIKLNSVAIGTPVSVEGYYDGTLFRAFIIDVDGPAQLTKTDPQISITRAQSRERTPNATRGDEIELRGSVTMTHAAAGINTQSIEVYRVDNGVDTQLDFAVAERDADNPNFASFRYRKSTSPSSDPVFGRAPTAFKVINASMGANRPAATSPAEVR